MKKEFDLSKLKVRLAKPEDAEGVAEIFKIGLGTKNFSMTGRRTPWDKKEIEKARKNYLDQGKGHFFFVAEFDKKIIGTMGYSFYSRGRTRHRGDLGWMVHPDFQGKGVGSKMMKFVLGFSKKRGFKRLEAEVAVKNKGSILLAKKFGFKIEGIKKKGLILDNGKHLDTYLFGKLL